MRTSKVPWSKTPDGHSAYTVARDEAQRKANETGYDYGIEANDLMRHWHVFLLPQKKNRYGYERFCEVVMCEVLDRCQPGHGPMAAS